MGLRRNMRQRHETEHERHERWMSRIEHKLDLILKQEGILMADQAELDQAIADLTTHTDSIDAAVTALVDKIGQSPAAADFATEVAALQAATGNLQTATDAANAALTPPAPSA
jgi:flagellin-like hook-associated protein FlgL